MMPRVALLLAIVFVGSAHADELRLKDGEIVFGQVTKIERGKLHLETATGERRIPAGDVAERIEGTAPHAAFAQRAHALADDDVEGHRLLLAFAWRHGLDARARALARKLLALDAQDALAGVLVGKASWQPAWGPVGRSGPRWGSARKRALSAGGGNAASERLVARALDWLARHQDEDGKLDADGFMRHDPETDPTDGAGGGHHGERVPCAYDGVTTALSLMAWLASGSTPVSGPYAKNVATALRYCLGHVRSGGAGFDAVWNLAFCTQAVADAYLVTRDPVLRVPLEGAVRRLLASQLSDGGWRYFGRVGGVPTTAAVGVALALAIQAGIAVPPEPIERVLAYLDGRIDVGTGRSEYHDGAERLGYTPTTANAAAALTVRAFLGRLGRTPHRGTQVSAISAKKPVWKIQFKEIKTSDGKTVRAQIGNLYPYSWYYQTLALHQHGGNVWPGWYGALKKALAKGQRKDGAAAGSWDPLGPYSDSGGRVFVTALCALMLQTPYRYPRP